MRFILTAKHWQVFLILIFGLFINNFSVEGNSMLTTILNIMGYLIYFLWPLLVVHGLQEYLPVKIELNYSFFLINAFVCIAGFIGVLIISDGQGMSFSGLVALPFLYMFYAFLYYLSFPGRTLRSIENRREASFSDYLGDFLSVVFLPIGIWFIQPRINRIVKENENVVN